MLGLEPNRGQRTYLVKAAPDFLLEALIQCCGETVLLVMLVSVPALATTALT